MTRGVSMPTFVTASLTGVLLLAGCATGRNRDPNPYSRDLAERNEVQIHIRNFNFSDATVWVLVRGARQARLGYVTGKSDAVFTVPWTFPDDMSLEFDLLADVRCVTETIPVDPGDILELQISANPRSDPQCR